ncbi:MAG: ribonuclease J [Rhodospirillaceae bacterium]
MAALAASFRPGADALYFLPLGGSGEIGMNLNLYGHAGKWLMVDLGIGFSDETMPGIDILVPDIAFIRERRRDLVGLVLTHAHEDHLGAVQHLWSELECPVFASPFTAAVLRAKLHEGGLVNRIKITEVPRSGTVSIGPFEVKMIGVTHSIPDSRVLVVRTSAGTVVHTGDWKLDAEPLVGPLTDEDSLAALATQNVLALVGDSTNAPVPGYSGTEASVREGLTQVIGRYEGRVAVTCFSTNVARLEAVAAAAAVHDRRVALIGRSLWRIYGAARSCGYLADLPEFVSEHDAGYLPRNKIVLVCTGSQGEPRSALSRIAASDHPQVVLERGDVVIFSSRDIPGNERAVALVQDRLLRRRIEVVTVNQEPVHVSGHPAQEELLRMLAWVKPRILVPVHGECRHQSAHVELARQVGVTESIIPTNGMLIRLSPGPAEVVAEVHHGKMAIDGKRIVPLDCGAMRSRHRVIITGAVVVTVVLNVKGELVTTPKLSILGLVDEQEDRDLVLDVIDAVREAVGALSKAARADDQALIMAVRREVRCAFHASHGKKPQTEVHLIRV